MSFSILNIIESSFSLAIFYLFYRIFLSKETFFKLNRIYLLSSIMFAVIIPFLNINLGNILNFSLGNNVFHEISGIKKDYNEINQVIIYAYSGKFTFAILLKYLRAIYILGLLISLVFFVFGLGKIILLIIRSKLVLFGKYRIVETSETIVPFSLFKWIIINPEKYSSDDMEQIIAHEKMHVFQLHSLDLVFIEVLVILFWFNPFIYWYRKSIREVHEYLADQAVVENGYDRINYQQLLLNQISCGRFVGLSSSFSYSLSKNRLKMLTMIKSKNISKTKIILAIPFAAAFIFFFTNQVSLVKASGHVENEISITADDTVKVKNNINDEAFYFVVEDMPTFQGKDKDEFRKFVQKNLKYPKIAEENGISGKVFVQFDVNSKGDVDNIVIIRGVDPSLDKEALEVVKSSPKWKPGIEKGTPVRVRFVFPIVFTLGDKTTK